MPIKPANDETVLTVFWADNFNMQRDTLSKQAVLYTTNVVAFQETEPVHVVQTSRLAVSKDIKQRSLPDDQSCHAEKPRLGCKIEPATFRNMIRQAVDENEVGKPNTTLLVWSILRVLASKDQTLPTLSGWLMQMRNGVADILVQRTCETLLPPTATSINDYGTIYRLFLFLQHLCTEVNMPYVNVIMDVGAAMNSYKVLWNFPMKFKNVMLYLGDFHFMKENFAVM